MGIRRLSFACTQSVLCCQCGCPRGQLHLKVLSALSNVKIAQAARGGREAPRREEVVKRMERSGAKALDSSMEADDPPLRYYSLGCPFQ